MCASCEDKENRCKNRSGSTFFGGRRGRAGEGIGMGDKRVGGEGRDGLLGSDGVWYDSRFADHGYLLGCISLVELHETNS